VWKNVQKYAIIELGRYDMFFADYETHKKEQISQSILWEYDTKAPDWDWNIMSKIVVARVLEYGRPEDYYAMLFQLE